MKWPFNVTGITRRRFYSCTRKENGTISGSTGWPPPKLASQCPALRSEPHAWNFRLEILRLVVAIHPTRPHNELWFY
jgi:hypothetical protein